MMQAWQRDKQRADVFLDPLRDILARTFIDVAPPEVDQKENADLVFLIEGKHVATRVRNMHLYHFCDARGVRYGDQITFRFSRPSRVATEFEKLLQGHGHYFLFAWGDYGTREIHAYTLLDLYIFRSWLSYVSFYLDIKPYRVHRNKDGTTFNAFDIADIRSDCIRAHVPLMER